jgi:hypothetical protein
MWFTLQSPEMPHILTPLTIFSDRNVKGGFNWLVNKNFTREIKNICPP